MSHKPPNDKRVRAQFTTSLINCPSRNKHLLPMPISCFAAVPECPEVAIFSQKIAIFLATFLPICKSFVIFSTKSLKFRLLFCQNSVFGIFKETFWLLLEGQSGSSVFTDNDHYRTVQHRIRDHFSVLHYVLARD